MLAKLEEGHVKELRHDFRALYHCCYDDVGISEAVDLILTLPRGSAYIKATHPEFSFTEVEEGVADLRDEMRDIAFFLRGISEPAPHVLRPKDFIAQQKAKKRSEEARKRLLETKWEAVD